LTFTILTTESGPRFRRFHNRVPAIAPTADAVDAFLVGDVDRALDLASRSNDELIAVDPPEPA
jgi:putative SOS response-associated peptidase YedK